MPYRVDHQQICPGQALSPGARMHAYLLALFGALHRQKFGNTVGIYELRDLRTCWVLDLSTRFWKVCFVNI